MILPGATGKFKVPPMNLGCAESTTSGIVNMVIFVLNTKDWLGAILTDSRLVAVAAVAKALSTTIYHSPPAAWTDRNSMADRPLTRVRQQSDRESSYYQNTEVTSTSSTDESSDDWQPQTPIQLKSSR
ncbi:hypothetical protein GX50_00426 [[Emmonsia] crescens]|uniref:Uncharacterized protein n=1 Tax=[Emmonsia] crescens TaxID=73230 RepID=A0A2B7ZRW2_9EURO|nr:hypothetical protein GX50_00426 [Emmonsia crescens]